MSYRLEGKDIVIEGFQDGIADSPYQGIADMRGVNITSVPGEASVNFKTSAMTIPPAVNALAFTVTNAGDLFTVSSTSGWYNGMAIVFNTIVSATGFSTNRVYYVGNISGSTFQIFESLLGITGAVVIGGGTPVTVTADGSGTLTSYQLAKPTHACTDNGETFTLTSAGVPSVASYIIDSKNQVWLLVSNNIGSQPNPLPTGTLLFAGNRSSTVGSGVNSIVVWSGYLFVFRGGATDYWDMDLTVAPVSTWAYSWAGFSPRVSTPSLRAIAAQDNAVYICNGSSVASILENPNETFDPTDNTTYTANSDALILPEGDKAICLAELGTNLLVGGTRSFVYPWDRVSPSFAYPLVVPERYISMILSTNSNAYIFAGNRGNIYITNGANVELYKKIPDYVTGSQQPYFIFGGAESVNSTAASGTAPSGDGLYWRNQIYFSFVTKSNSGSTLTTTTGLWAIDTTTGALRLAIKMSYNTYAGKVAAVIPDLMTFNPYGEGLFCAWEDGNGTVGVDNSVATPYAGGETYIDTDIVPVGTFLDKFTSTQVEWKTSVPLGNNGTSETIAIYYRSNLSDSFTLIGSTTVSSAATEDQPNLSDVYQANFQKVQWIQLRVVLTSNATTPTYNRLTQLRIRDWPND